MFVKLTNSGGRRYVQLVESYRDDQGRVKKRTVATLGRYDQLSGELESVIKGLSKIAGQDPPQSPANPPKLRFSTVFLRHGFMPGHLCQCRFKTDTVFSRLPI